MPPAFVYPGKEKVCNMSGKNANHECNRCLATTYQNTRRSICHDLQFLHTHTDQFAATHQFCLSKYSLPTTRVSINTQQCYGSKECIFSLMCEWHGDYTSNWRSSQIPPLFFTIKDKHNDASVLYARNQSKANLDTPKPSIAFQEHNANCIGACEYLETTSTQVPGSDCAIEIEPPRVEHYLPSASDHALIEVQDCDAVFESKHDGEESVFQKTITE